MRFTLVLRAGQRPLQSATGGSTTALERMNMLLAQTPLTWQAVHVATVYDTVSTCNLISANFLHYNRSRVIELTKSPPLSWGKFTQHTIDRWDGISINDTTIPKSDFERLESKFSAGGEQIGATRSEIMTAIAFQAFTDAKVDIGIVEAMSAAGDDEPTNIIGTPSGDLVRASPICTLLFQQPWSTLGEQILQKQAALFKPGVPVLSIPLYNLESVAMLRRHAEEAGTTIVTRADLLEPLKIPDIEKTLRNNNDCDMWIPPWPPEETWESAFMAAFSVLMHFNRLNRPVDVRKEKFDFYLGCLLHNFEVQWQWADDSGATRYMYLLIAGSTDDTIPVRLVPDATVLETSFNEAAVDARECQTPDNLIWLIAAEEGADLSTSVRFNVRHDDFIITTAFREVDGQPHRRAIAPQALLQTIKQAMGGEHSNTVAMDSVQEAVQEAARLAEKHGNIPIVVIGSRWLVSDLLRMVRDGVIKRVPSTQDRHQIEKWTHWMYLNKETGQLEC